MEVRSFQDSHPHDLAWCCGCGRVDEHGHRIKSAWDGDQTVCAILPAGGRACAKGGIVGVRMPERRGR